MRTRSRRGQLGSDNATRVPDDSNIVGETATNGSDGPNSMEMPRLGSIAGKTTNKDMNDGTSTATMEGSLAKKPPRAPRSRQARSAQAQQTEGEHRSGPPSDATMDATSNNALEALPSASRKKRKLQKKPTQSAKDGSTPRRAGKSRVKQPPMGSSNPIEALSTGRRKRRCVGNSKDDQSTSIGVTEAAERVASSQNDAATSPGANMEIHHNGGWENISSCQTKGGKRRKPDESQLQPAESEDARDAAAAAEPAEGEGEGNANGDIGEEVHTKKRRRRRRSHSLSADDDDEDYIIDIKETVMWDLTSDSRKGKVSKLERAFRQINWKEVKKRKEEEALRALEAPDEETNDQSNQPDELTVRLEAADEAAQQASGGAVDESAPGMKIVNGQLVFDTTTADQPATDDLQATVEAQAAAAEATANEDTINGYAESDLTNRITTATWRGSQRRHRLERHVAGRGGNRWTEAGTDKFYDAIRIFGADFTIIQKMFPDRTRRQIKLKFVREEKSDPARMREVMVGPISEKTPMSLEKYAEMTGMDEEDADGDAGFESGTPRMGRFKDPKLLELELEVEREKQQMELEEERKELEESVRMKKERAGERQKLKEKARRDRKKKGADSGGADKRTGEQGVTSPAAHVEEADTRSEIDQGRKADESGVCPGHAGVTQSIEK